SGWFGCGYGETAGSENGAIPCRLPKDGHAARNPTPGCNFFGRSDFCEESGALQNCGQTGLARL
ncbi:hypothetical protein, partial [Mesorhizobium sp. M7A.F.Ca.US.006.01.1.1]|uniref:hypothetical protein n=1 Tax=Mesorhizobium sp. M7A.F.Ca.US.006.01.1.1 TaxID=2496707 RepID=UPI0019D28BA7